MENAPHIILTSINTPTEIEEKYRKWQDEVYASIYMKLPGYAGIDYYKIVKKTLEYPASVLIHHAQNRNVFEESRKNPIRVAIQKDSAATFYRIEWFWHDVYALIGSFRNDSSSRESGIVENAPIIHIEGYRVPPAEQQKYDQWFMRWASRVYIPIIMGMPGLKAYNCFGLSDLSVRFPGRRYLQAEIPPYVSILYFENMESVENYEASPAYAAFKRSMELELPSGVETIWNIQYQLRKSFRK